MASTMHRIPFALGAAVWVVLGLGAAAAQNAAAPPAEDRTPPESVVSTPARQGHASRREDERAIRQVVDDFVKAYNGHDAAAVAALFTPDGLITSEDGKATSGRKAIEQVFDGVFKEHPKTRIEDTIESIRFVNTTQAIEDGRTTVIHGDAAPTEKNRYRVVHVKRNGKWLMASAADLPEDTWTGEEEMKRLSGLIGDWVDESPDALVITSYHWTDNRRFILSQFTVQMGGRPAMTGTQRIGWDPLKKTIRSWVFDSEGGFGEGTWTQDGNQWIIKRTGVTRDGRPASATNTITLVGKDRMTWQSRNRVVGGEKLPDIEEIPIVRQPPQPKQHKQHPSAPKP
jgi:uncharacterized protein (TIGR02246 family)